MRGCNDGNIEGIVTWVYNSINDHVDWCVAGLLGTCFDGNEDEMTLGIDKGTDLGF